MSAIDWVYQNSKHTGNTYHVLITLAIAYGEQGACLSMKDIADRTKISEATARRAIESLTADGTIMVIRNGGEKRKNGTTNCYRFIGHDTPVTQVTPPDMIPLSSDDTPANDTGIIQMQPLSSSTTEYTYTRGDAGAPGSFVFTEQKELKEPDNNHANSVKVIDTRAQDVAPMTEADLDALLGITSPEIREQFPALLAKAQPAPEQQSTPNPGSGDPLPPDVLGAYVERCGYTPTGKETESLEALVKLHGAEKTATLIRDCERQDRYGDPVKNPAGWVLKTGKNKPSWNPKPIAAAPAPDYTVPPERQALNDYLADFIR